MRRRISLLLVVLALVVPATPARADSSPWVWPLGSRDVGRTFDRVDRYAAGHRGVDLPGSPGDTVRAVAAGQVTFAGLVAGVPAVTVDHGGERSTYQPVEARVEVGDAVTAGEVVGTLRGGHGACVTACLHLGRLAGDAYLDPLDKLVGPGRFRLVDPHGPPPPPPPPPPSATGDGSLRRPVGGPVTSAYGMRVHPVTGVRKLHDGTDFGVPCGTPVRSAGAGIVVGRSSGTAYGRRVEVRHDSGLVTSYNHLSSAAVAVGRRVSVGEVVGRVGSTGLSTGCHLHFMVERDGRPVNPQGFL